MRRWAIWAANAVLFTLGCFLLARIVVAILAEVALPERAEVAPVRMADRGVERTWADHQVVLTRNIFGAKLSGAEVEVIPDPGLEAAKTKLPLELLGTVAGEDASVSSAAIHDIGTRKHQVVFVGDRLDNHPTVEVHSIARAVVYLRSAGKLEKLVLKEEDDTDRGAVQPARAANRRRAAARGRRQRPTESVTERLQQEVGARTTAALYSQARIVPKWEDGQMVGVQLNQVKPGSLYEQIGIRSGDVITSLNGISIDNPQASSKLLSEFTQAKNFTIVMGDGRTLEVDESQLPQSPGDSDE